MEADDSLQRSLKGAAEITINIRLTIYCVNETGYIQGYLELQLEVKVDGGWEVCPAKQVHKMLWPLCMVSSQMPSELSSGTVLSAGSLSTAEVGVIITTDNTANHNKWFANVLKNQKTKD